jgi:hypothetical protein
MQNDPTIKKLRADSPEAGPYGPNITRGKYVFGCYDGERLIAIAATAGEARRIYRKALSRFYAARK